MFCVKFFFEAKEVTGFTMRIYVHVYKGINAIEKTNTLYVIISHSYYDSRRVQKVFSGSYTLPLRAFSAITCSWILNTSNLSPNRCAFEVLVSIVLFCEFP